MVQSKDRAHLFPRSGHLAQRVGVGGHVGEDDEDVHAALVREVLRGGERDARRDDALNRGICTQREMLLLEQHASCKNK